MMKKVLGVIIALFLTGCAVAPYGSMGRVSQSPQPFNADALMEWAKGVPGAEMTGHERSARVNVHNGGVEISTSEVASSRKGTPSAPPPPVYQQFYFRPYY